MQSNDSTYSNEKTTSSNVQRFENMRTLDGLAYAMNESSPYTGEVNDYYSNGQKKSESHYKNGKQTGLSIKWFENGQKEMEVNIRDGVQHGLATSWLEDGQKQFEVMYENGTIVSDARKFISNESKNNKEKNKTNIIDNQSDKKDDSLIWGRNEFENNIQIMVLSKINEQSSFRGFATGRILETDLYDNGVVETKFKLYFHENDQYGNWEKAKYEDGDDLFIVMTDRKSSFNHGSAYYITTIDFRFLNLNKSDSHGLKIKMYDPKTQQIAAFLIEKSEIDKLNNKVKELQPDVIYNIVAKAFKEERYNDGVGWAVSFLQKFPGHENGKALSRSLIEIYSFSKEKQKARKIYDDAIHQYSNDVQFCTDLTELYNKKGLSYPAKQSKNGTIKIK